MDEQRQDFLEQMEGELRGDGGRGRRVARTARAMTLTAAVAGSLLAFGATAAEAGTGAQQAPAAPSGACNSPSGGPYPEAKPESQTIVCNTMQYVWTYAGVPSPLCYQFTGKVFGGPCGAPVTEIPDHTSCI